jgi:hypothetical protein
LAHDFATAQELKDMEKEIRKQDDAAVAKAKESPMPDQYELFTNVYVNDCGLESGSTMNRRPQPRRRHPRAGQGGCYQGRRFQQRFGSATKSRITCWIERRLLQPQVEHVPQHHQVRLRFLSFSHSTGVSDLNAICYYHCTQQICRNA